tara:strand:- start:1311 stop:2036 length:726 start_codon:yes stop_codon:yes gene_type:complete
MNEHIDRTFNYFFGTRSLPCPYIEGRIERKIVTDLRGPGAEKLYQKLSHAGFRRSHNLAYSPACPNCEACVPVRIMASDFKLTRSFSRVKRINKDLFIEEMDSSATIEQFNLFSAYQRERHSAGEMVGMTFNDYKCMVEDTPVTSGIIEFRKCNGKLVGVMLMDRLEDGLSAVYSFFDIMIPRHSLGTFMILWMIEQASQYRLPYVYLGYWVENCDNMSYKTRFQPVEMLRKNIWSIFKAP